MKQRKMSILHHLSEDLQNKHSLYCTSTDYAQFSLLDSALTSFNKFKVSNIILMDPRGISHNPWKQYLKNTSAEMALNGFSLLSKSSEVLAGSVIETIANTLKEDLGPSYAKSLTKIVEPAINRYELDYKESKLTLYHINYDVAAILLLLKQMNNQEHFSSSCSTGIVLNSVVGDWGAISLDDIQSFLMKINLKPHYVITNNLTVWENYTSPSPLAGELTIRFETPFLREYFEMLKS